MDRREVETPLGRVVLWGRETGRPTLLVVTGLFASATTFDHFQRVFPALDVLRTHLPGNHCPPLSVTSIDAFGQALTFALQSVGGPVAILGSSVGGLVALSVEHPRMVARLLVEPPLDTRETWPLRAPELAEREPELMSALLGRDFTPLALASDVPTEVLVGGIPLMPPRQLEALPSLLSDATVARLSASPAIRVVRAEGAGHGVAKDAGPIFAATVQRLVSRLEAPADQPIAARAEGSR